MRLTTFTTLRELPGYSGLALAMLLLGLTKSITEPYITLFAVNQAHMSPVQLGVFLSLLSLSAILISTRLAHRFDRKPGRRLALLALALAAAGYLLLTTTTNYLLLTLIAVVFLAAGAAPFPQLFAVAKGHLDHLDSATATHGITALRSSFSLAWAVGPFLGAAILARFGFHGLFLATAAFYLLTLWPVSRVKDFTPGTAVVAHSSHQQVLPGQPIWPVLASFVLFYTAMSMGIIALPIYVTRTAHGSASDVGLMFGLSALLEMVVMLGLVLLPFRFSTEGLIRLALALFVLYFALVAALPYVGWLVVAQGIRAISIALVMSLGISYFQSLMPGRVGFATALFSNSAIAAEIIASLGAGVWAQAFGYQAIFPLCAVLAGVSWALMFLLVRQASDG